MDVHLKELIKPHIFHDKILENQIDTYGHVNHATYLTLFETARWDLITGNNYGQKEIDTYQKGPIVLEARIKYVKEIKVHDEITIYTWPEKTNKRIGKIYQEIHGKNKEIHAKLQITCGLMDLQTRKLIRPTPEWSLALTGMTQEK